MKSFVRSWALVALVVFAAVCVNTTTEAGITYDLVNHPSIQNDYTLTGSITTDGTLGGLAGSNIVSWLFSVTNGTDTYSNSSTTGSLFLFMNVTATSSGFLLEASGQLQLGAGNETNVLWLRDTNPVYSAYTPDVLETRTLWYDGPTSYPVDGSNWIVATATANVPEIDPASFGSAFALLIGSLGLVERRARRAIVLLNSAA